MYYTDNKTDNNEITISKLRYIIVLQSSILTLARHRIVIVKICSLIYYYIYLLTQKQRRYE